MIQPATSKLLFNGAKSGFIVGGTTTQRGQFPFMALLGYEKSIGTLYLCGGTLLNRRYVLTAAHCHNPRKESASVRQVVLGEYIVGQEVDCFDCLPAQK